MKCYLYFCVVLPLVAALVGCGLLNGPPPAPGRHAAKRSMPPLERLCTQKGTAAVFGPAETCEGSPRTDVVRQWLFNTHQPKTNKFAIPANGDVSFAARVQLLEMAQKSTRTQALIFAGDESGLHIAEILKRKKAEGIRAAVMQGVRVVILSNSPGTNDLPEPTMVGRS